MEPWAEKSGVYYSSTRLLDSHAVSSERWDKRRSRDAGTATAPMFLGRRKAAGRLLDGEMLDSQCRVDQDE
jgi:hypothetical protein